MRNLMRLDEAINKKIVRNLDMMDPNALFDMKRKKVVLDQTETGIEEMQEFYRQDFDYTFFKIREKGGRSTTLYMIAKIEPENKESEVSLRGVNGFYGLFALSKLANMYTNLNNGITANRIYAEDFLKSLLERNKKFNGFESDTWTRNRESRRTEYGSIEYIQKVIQGREISDKVMCNSEGDWYSASCNYCPMITISYPADILVVLNSKNKTGKWKLIPKKGNLLLKLKYGLF